MTSKRVNILLKEFDISLFTNITKYVDDKLKEVRILLTDVLKALNKEMISNLLKISNLIYFFDISIIQISVT